MLVFIFIFSFIFFGLTRSAYIQWTIGILAIMIILLNSFQVAWIAFLPKREKVHLLLLSLLIASIFGFHFGMSFSDGSLTRQLLAFSPGLLMVYRETVLLCSAYFGVIFVISLFHLPTARVFDQKVEEVSSLLDLSKILTQVFDLRQMADQITGTLGRVCHADSVWLVTVDSGGAVTLRSRVDIDAMKAEKVSQILIQDRLLDQKQTLVLKNKKLNLPIGTDTFIYKFGALVIAPLKIHDKNLGYLFAMFKESQRLDEAYIGAVSTFAGYASVALENAQLIHGRLEQERLQQELEVARKIQLQLLPQQIPSFASLEISTHFSPAHEVGGDYYDFFQINDEQLGFIIADVSGKGIGASFIMAEIKGIFETLSLLQLPPKELMVRANAILKKSLDPHRFVTAFYGLFDVKDGKLSLCRAGHPPVIRCQDGILNRVYPKGAGLGILAAAEFSADIESVDIQLQAGEIIAFYTDGVSETQNVKGEVFGIKRFEQVLLTYSPGRSLPELTEFLLKEMDRFGDSEVQHDDITMVLFKWLG